ncbi:MAG: septum formation family protein [Micrococcaceae bacterium]|nr:septum formation family protein [Micrococcaceae bacterium]
MSQKRSWWRAPALWALVGALGVLLIVVYGVNKFFAQDPGTAPVGEVTRNASPGLDGIIAMDVPADQLQVGDCLQGFVSPLEDTTVVTCLTAHNAQLIETFKLKGDEFPGPARILAESQELCKSVPLDPTSPLDTSWSYHFSRPSETSWKAGDRLVACFVALDEGTVRESVLPSKAPELGT